MKNLLSSLIILLFLYECSAQTSQNFLDKFYTLKEIPSSESIKSLKIELHDTIPVDILSRVFLLSRNEIEYSHSYTKNKYYYYGKYKLNDRFYVIVYKKFYEHDHATVVINIYDNINNVVISKLTIEDSYKTIRKTSFSDGFFIIKNIYRIPNGLDPPPDKQFVIKEVIEKYKIDNNFIFTKVK